VFRTISVSQLYITSFVKVPFLLLHLVSHYSSTYLYLTPSSLFAAVVSTYFFTEPFPRRMTR
jgi:hypothetical protein